jgi:hypothetical protein
MNDRKAWLEEQRKQRTEIDTAKAKELETHESGLLTMVVTLKSGTQIRMRVSEYTIQRSPLRELVGIKWTATEDNTVSLKYLDVDEVAAIHSEF